MESLKERPQVLQQFAESVKNWVQEKRDAYPHPNDGDAFSHWALELTLPELDSDEIFDLLDIAGKDDQGLDAYYRDERDGVYYLFQSKFAEQPRGAGSSRSFGVDVVRELFTAFQLLSNPTAAHRISKKLGQIAEGFQDALNKNYEVRFCYLLFGWLSENALNELEARLETLSYGNVSSMVYNLDEIYGLYLQIEGPQEVTELIKIPYYAYYQLSDNGPRAIVANINLVQFALNVAPHRPAIYSANVRNPLGYNMVNKGMRKTLRDVTDRDYFWHYNNGLTILCNSVQVDEQLLHITIQDPSIINGCQTTETIIRNLEFLGDSDLPILVRFIELPNHRDENLDTALKIARFTNSQTQVIAPDLRSTDAIQTEIKMSFEQLPEPWFFERKRGEYNFLRQRGDIDQRDYSKWVKMPDVAQRWRAFDGHPASAISQKAELFESDEIYNSIFSPNRTAYEFAVAYLIYEQLRASLKSRLDAERIKDKPNERIIHLTKAANLACAQMLALSRSVLEMKYGAFDLAIARFVFEQIQDEAKNPIKRMFPVLLGCLLSKLQDHPNDTAHSILRDRQTFSDLKIRLVDQLHLAQDTYGTSPLDSLDLLS